MTTATATICRNPVILTRYLGPTNTRGSRVKATTGSGVSVTLDWDHELDADENHARAAVALCVRRWAMPEEDITLRGGCHDKCDGFAWTVSRRGVYA